MNERTMLMLQGEAMEKRKKLADVNWNRECKKIAVTMVLKYTSCVDTDAYMRMVDRVYEWLIKD